MELLVEGHDEGLYWPNLSNQFGLLSFMREHRLHCFGISQMQQITSWVDSISLYLLLVNS